MNIVDLVEEAKYYMELGITVALPAAVIFITGYFLVYQKITKGTKRIPVKSLLWGIVFGGYLLVVAGATLLNRGEWSGGVPQLHLFKSYWEAWYSMSMIQWRNIILNILMFVPIGFLLPVGIKKMRKAWRVYLAGFLLTLLIECTQYVTDRGIFELDDLFDNLLGAMIGYGVYAICHVINLLIKREKLKIGRTLAAQLPLLGTIMLFSGIYINYNNQELGNLECHYIYKTNLEQVEVRTTQQYSDQKKEVEIYC